MMNSWFDCTAMRITSGQRRDSTGANGRFDGGEIMENATLVGSRIRSAASLRERIVAKEDGNLGATDSAFCALTDFELDFPITVDVDASIDAAFQDMARLGIHALLVTRRGLRGIEPQVEGLITAHDIERARSERKAFDDRTNLPAPLKVGDVMSPWDELSAVKYESLDSLTALDLYEMFQGTGLTHLLVVEAHNDDVAVARGVLSRATLAKRLGQVRQSTIRQQ
jgi:CBS domain-containing protein